MREPLPEPGDRPISDVIAENKARAEREQQRAAEDAARRERAKAEGGRG